MSTDRCCGDIPLVPMRWRSMWCLRAGRVAMASRGSGSNRWPGRLAPQSGCFKRCIRLLELLGLIAVDSCYYRAPGSRRATLHPAHAAARAARRRSGPGAWPAPYGGCYTRDRPSPCLGGPTESSRAGGVAVSAPSSRLHDLAGQRPPVSALAAPLPAVPTGCPRTMRADPRRCRPRPCRHPPRREDTPPGVPSTPLRRKHR